MEEQMTFEFTQRPTIKGFPELRWTGKRPYRFSQYYPAQLRESYGDDKDGWINKIFWGDNLQVMSHLYKDYRGKIDLIYIDPPFDSKADYKKKIEVKGIGKTETDSTSFEEKQYGDIWTNDEYLQFMYERLIIMRELLADTGTLYLHCDWHKAGYIRCVLDEVFGHDNFINEIVWGYEDIGSRTVKYFKRKHDTVFMYGKTNSENRTFNVMRKRLSESTIKRYKPYFDTEGKITYRSLKESNPGVFAKLKGIPEDLDSAWLDINNGAPLSDWWVDISALKSGFSESTEYPTQKPEALIERIIKASSNPGDLVFDCFMGSGTTQAVAMKLGRRFIGADINLGAIQTTTKRLINVADELNASDEENDKYTGFEVYNVNNYDFFRNPIEARELLIEALEIQPFPQSDLWDGELDGRMVKIMPVNRIATKADLEELKANMPYKTYEKRKEENPSLPVERITIVCMGHEPDLKVSLEAELSDYKFDIQIVDILRDKSELQLKREAEAEIVREGNKLVVRAFYPMNLMQKLSLQKEYVEDWRQLVESIMIDWNYDGVVMQPIVTDVPDKKGLVIGIYDIPENAGKIKIKITDLLSESLEMEV
ncbi:MAG: site-specific DNA-methyltransferase [Lachnospiraceae bacterium]|nr:site-specific DNA-methyltransferase [Lachnospiraceae bacterium]